MEWQPTRIHATTWAEAAKSYKQLDERNLGSLFTPMRRLCEHVERALEWNCGMLRIASTEDLERYTRAVTRRGEVSFALHEQPFVKPSSFHCAPERVIETFEGFLRKNKWLSEAALVGEHS